MAGGKGISSFSVVLLMAVAAVVGVACFSMLKVQYTPSPTEKNLTVDYTFPEKITEKLKISNLKVYVSLENLFTFSPIYRVTDMFDPEVIDSGDSDFSTTRGLNGQGDGFSYPMLKSYTFGINITF